MVKIKAGAVDGFAKRPDDAIRVVLLYGPDTGRIAELDKVLAKSVVNDIHDPFSIVDLAAKTLTDDPARLPDESAAINMLGGRRVLRITDAGDTLTKVFKGFVEDPVGDALIVLRGGDLGPRSTLRQLCEKADNAAALPCYIDEGRDLQAVIAQTLKDNGLNAEPEALSYLLTHLGADRLVTRMELEKLAQYKGIDGGSVTLDDVQACVGDSAAQGLDDLVFGVADGNITLSQSLLDRLRAEGTPSIVVLRAVSRHFLRLQWVSGQIAQGKPQDVAVKGLKPPLFFKKADAFRRQLRQWNPDRLATAIGLLQSAEIDCKTTGYPDTEICSRVLIQVARAAGRAR